MQTKSINFTHRPNNVNKVGQYILDAFFERCCACIPATGNGFKISDNYYHLTDFANDLLVTIETSYAR